MWACVVTEFSSGVLMWARSFSGTPASLSTPGPGCAPCSYGALGGSSIPYRTAGSTACQGIRD